MPYILFFLLVTSSLASHRLHKRSNIYGDELIVPAEIRVEVQAEPKQQYAEEEVSVVDAPSSNLNEEHTVQAEVERSGYRLKRSNAYGDELIVPEQPEVTVVASAAGKPSYGEEEVAVVNSEPYGEVQTHPTLNVQESGYRMKRNIRVIRANEYGDEQIVPEVTVEDKLVSRAEYDETAPVVAQVQEYEPAPAAVEHVQRSGYRRKRNTYGDELIVPATVLQAGPAAPVTEVVSPVVDQTYVGQVVAARPAISPIAPTIVQTTPEQYILSKQSLSYGDETVIPAKVPVIPAHHLRYAEVPLTYGSLFSSRHFPTAPMVVSSGYATAKKSRLAKKRLH